MVFCFAEPFCQLRRVKKNFMGNGFFFPVFDKNVASGNVAGVEPPIASFYIRTQQFVIFLGVAADQNLPSSRKKRRKTGGELLFIRFRTAFLFGGAL